MPETPTNARRVRQVARCPECGLFGFPLPNMTDPKCGNCGAFGLEMFVEIEALAQARAEEREACAKEAEAWYTDPGWHDYFRSAAITIANAIRSRA